MIDKNCTLSIVIMDPIPLTGRDELPKPGEKLWLVGYLEGNKLHCPRVFEIRKRGTEFALTGLPFVPLVITLPPGFLTYPIPVHEKALIALWRKVTDPEEIAKANKPIELREGVH